MLHPFPHISDSATFHGGMRKLVTELCPLAQFSTCLDNNKITVVKRFFFLGGGGDYTLELHDDDVDTSIASSI